MNVLKMFDRGRKNREESARREADEKRQEIIDERREVFGRTMMKAELEDCLKVPYENRLLRAMVQVIRTVEVRYGVLAMQNPMDETAHEMTARQAALRDLENELLNAIDRANAEVEK